jgi:hypothetical protein
LTLCTYYSHFRWSRRLVQQCLARALARHRRPDPSRPTRPITTYTRRTATPSMLRGWRESILHSRVSRRSIDLVPRQVTLTSLLICADSVYLDHAAAPPAPAAPLAAFASSLQSQLLSNPHSSTTAGVQTALVIDRTRTRVLQDLFNVPDDRLAEWDVVFTHGGATQGIKMIGDSWDWDAENEETAALEYLVESHTRCASFLRHICCVEAEECVLAVLSACEGTP